MTDEQLTRGKVLSDEIKELKNRIYKWKNADSVQSLTIHYPTDYPAGGNNYTDRGEYVNWEVLRTLTLQSMNNRLQELEKEYAEL